MKPITLALLLTLAGAGAACSDTVSGASEAPAEVTPASADVQGTLNLNIGRANDAGSRPIVGAAPAAGPSGLIVGPGQSGGNFEGVQDLGIQIEEAPHDPLAPPAPSDEDELIRIPDKR